jgi:anti-sigma-K factor RskA
MSDTAPIAPEDADRVQAAEYVLGVLSAEERRAVETRMAQEAAFAREIAGWEERLGGMASYVSPAQPPAQIWLRIEASLGAPSASATAAPGSLWQSLALWRGLAIGSLALAAACVAALFYVGAGYVGTGFVASGHGGLGSTPPTPPRTPLLVTLTGSQTKQSHFVAAIGADGASLTITPTAPLTADKRSMELWLIPQGGKPASLGLIAASQPVQLNVPPQLLQHVGTGATLAVSLEPLGGSPTGEPTGPIIANGNLSRL